MANEITKLAGDGHLRADLLFLYPITPPTYQGDGAEVTVVQTPSAGLPEMAANVLSDAEKAALDAGTLAFQTAHLDAADAMTGAELLAAARELYAVKMAAFTDRLDRAYSRAGQRFGA